MNKNPVRIIVTGCCGRMGSLILEEAAKNSDFKIMGGVEHEGHPQLGQALPVKPNLKITSDLKSLLKKADLIIEFTTPEATISHAKIAAEAGIPMLIGTTGLDTDQYITLQILSQHQIPIFWSPNMSLGIVVVRRMIETISNLILSFGLAEKTKAQISETHHIQKKDKPSGTAKALAEELLKHTGWLIREEEIEAHREGEVIGIHSVVFNLESERITISHEATDRHIFAQGALVVARQFHKIWQTPGFYQMDDFVRAMQQMNKTR